MAGRKMSKKEWEAQNEAFKMAIARVKSMYTVPDILRMYGVPVHNKRCKSFCHSGTHQTAKVSNELYYCFKCNLRYDVLGLVQHFNGCSFEEAVEYLGGSREMTPEEQKRAEEQKKTLAQRKKERTEKERKYIYWRNRKRYYGYLMEAAPEGSLEKAHWLACWQYCDIRLEGVLTV